MFIDSLVNNLPPAPDIMSEISGLDPTDPKNTFRIQGLVAEYQTVMSMNSELLKNFKDAVSKIISNINS